MICWDLIWGYYRRNWWHWIYCVFGICFMWLLVFLSATRDFKFLIVLLAMQHPLYMEQVGDVYRKLPISRPTLVRTLNLHGIFLDVIVFSGLMLLTDLIWWLAGNNIQSMLWSQSFWLGVLLILRCLFHIFAMRTTFEAGRRGFSRTLKLNKTGEVLLMALLVGIFMLCGFMRTEFIINPGIAISAGLGACLICWKTVHDAHAVLAQTQQQRPVQQSIPRLSGGQRISHEWDCFFLGFLIGIISILPSIIRLMSKNLDAQQVEAGVMTKFPVGYVLGAIFPLVIISPVAWHHSMRLLRALPWSPWRHELFFARRICLLDIGYLFPWLLIMRIEGSSDLEFSVFIFYGISFLCLQMGYLLLSLKVTTSKRFLLQLLIGALSGILIQVASIVCHIGQGRAVFPAWMAFGIELSILIWLGWSIAHTIRQSSLPYRRQQG